MTSEASAVENISNITLDFRLVLVNVDSSYTPDLAFLENLSAAVM